MSSYFKHQAWSMYKQATEAEATQGWWGYFPIVPHHNSTHIAHWLILLLRCYDNNSNIVKIFSMEKRNLKQLPSLDIHFVQHTKCLYNYARRSKELNFTKNPCRAYIIWNNQRWSQLAMWRSKFIEPSLSHGNQITGMKRKKQE